MKLVDQAQRIDQIGQPVVDCAAASILAHRRRQRRQRFAPACQLGQRRRVRQTFCRLSVQRAGQAFEISASQPRNVESQQAAVARRLGCVTRHVGQVAVDALQAHRHRTWLLTAVDEQVAAFGQRAQRRLVAAAQHGRQVCQLLRRQRVGDSLLEEGEDGA